MLVAPIGIAQRAPDLRGDREVPQGRPGAAIAKSIKATARPSRKTTFSGYGSLWQITGPPVGSAHWVDQSCVLTRNVAVAS